MEAEQDPKAEEICRALMSWAKAFALKQKTDGDGEGTRRVDSMDTAGTTSPGHVGIDRPGSPETHVRIVASPSTSSVASPAAPVPTPSRILVTADGNPIRNQLGRWMDGDEVEAAIAALRSKLAAEEDSVRKWMETAQDLKASAPVGVTEAIDWKEVRELIWMTGDVSEEDADYATGQVRSYIEKRLSTGTAILMPREELDALRRDASQTEVARNQADDYQRKMEEAEKHSKEAAEAIHSLWQDTVPSAPFRTWFATPKMDVATIRQAFDKLHAKNVELADKLAAQRPGGADVDVCAREIADLLWAEPIREHRRLDLVRLLRKHWPAPSSHAEAKDANELSPLDYNKRVAINDGCECCGTTVLLRDLEMSECGTILHCEKGHEIIVDYRSPDERSKDYAAVADMRERAAKVAEQRTYLTLAKEIRALPIAAPSAYGKIDMTSTVPLKGTVVGMYGKAAAESAISDEELARELLDARCEARSCPTPPWDIVTPGDRQELGVMARRLRALLSRSARPVVLPEREALRKAILRAFVQRTGDDGDALIATDAALAEFKRLNSDARPARAVTAEDVRAALKSAAPSMPMGAEDWDDLAKRVTAALNSRLNAGATEARK